MKIWRIYQDLDKYLKPNKVLVIYGPRRVGKTTLLKDFLSQTKLKYKLDSGDDLRTQEILGSQDFKKLKEYAEGFELLAIDEAQRIPGIGQGLKILVDQIPNLRIIVTGSSSFDLIGQLGEPLTGRKTTLTLYPLSQIELVKEMNTYELRNRVEEYLIYGSFPEVVTSPLKKEKVRALEELTGSYLLKDILELDKVKSSKKLVDLLRLIAFQVGNEVSLSELGTKIGSDVKTVARYLDLLEKSFVICELRGFSRNLRKEITKKSKYYFYDTGVRNAIISNFNGLELRNDVGALWENFIFVERLKKRAYREIYANQYFWRTWDRKEIDLVEEREGKLFGYEIKWSPNKERFPKDWMATYPDASLEEISKSNYLDFVL